jgi:SNF2 family DNA or RNA helicase
MAILHGSWIHSSHSQLLYGRQVVSAAAAEPQSSRQAWRVTGCFFIWGEQWRRLEGQPQPHHPEEYIPHPFAMDRAELVAFLRSLHPQRLNWGALTAKATHSDSFWEHQWRSLQLWLPVHPVQTEAGTMLLPQHSEMNPDAEPDASTDFGSEQALQPWQVGGICLPPLDAIQFLHALPLGLQGSADAFLGGDLRFWSHGARWSLDLLARSKFLPELLGRSPDQRQARWQVILDSAIDQERLARFTRRMPLVCQAYRVVAQQDNSDSQNGPVEEPVSKTKAKRDHRKTGADPATLPSVSDAALAEGADGEAIAVAPAGQPPTGSTLDLQEITATPLLMDFLQDGVDAQVRAAISAYPLPATQFPKDIPLREWLQALRKKPTPMGTAASAPPNRTNNGSRVEAIAPMPPVPAELALPTFTAVPEDLERLEATLNVWLAPIQHQLTQQTAAFRTGFILHTPTAETQEWRLDYCLQATNDPAFVVPAAVVWAHAVDALTYGDRTIPHPQETLLAGLGLASRLYPVIESSLQVRQPCSAVLDPNQVYDFLKVVSWRLQENGLGVILPPSLSSQQSLANRLGLSVRLEPPKTGKNQRLGLQSLLNFKWELSIGGQRLSKAEFDRLVALNTPLVEINGEWVELRPQDIRAAQTFFESRKDQRSLSLEDALRISTGDTQLIEKLPVVDFEASGALQELLNTLTQGNQGIEPLDPPATFQGELRPYQVRGMSWLVFLQRWGLGACLADDMGLGKTIQLIAMLQHLKEQKRLQKPTLLVCPTSVLSNWEREVRRFAPNLKAVVHHGDRRLQSNAFAEAAQKQDLIITSYALTYRDFKTLQVVSWQGVVLDEAQNIKNPQAKQSQAVRDLDAEFRVALTGTPVENRLSELWSIMDFLNPGYLGPRNFFQRRFAIPIERYGDTASLKSLRALVQPFILRRLKTDRTIIQDLPEKQEMTVFCGLSPEQANLYQQFVEQSLAEIESAEGIQRRGMILALLTHLKQVCNHPVLVTGEKKRKADKDVALLHQQSGKLQRLRDMLEELLSEGDRALIFTQFAEWGKHLQAYLEHAFRQEVLFLYGSSTKAQREAMVDRFQQDPQGPRIFVLSLKAGGVGLNLTRANHVFHFDRWWNPAVENQATDRVFRIGQTRNVQVHKFVCTGTLEERIHEIIESKRQLSEQIVGTGENWLTDLNTDQLRSLLLLDRDAILSDDEG